MCPKFCVGPFTQLDGGDQGGSGRRVLWEIQSGGWTDTDSRQVVSLLIWDQEGGKRAHILLGPSNAPLQIKGEEV